MKASNLLIFLAMRIILLDAASAETVGDGVAHLVVDAAVDFGVDLADMVHAAAGEEAAFAVEILRLLEVGEDIIFFIDEGSVECSRP